jgi:hypothetical protein
MSDFIADLRERRLLPIIALLLVCLIAIPFLMGGGGDEAVPPPPTASGEPLPGIETRPVVVATPAELRNYSKRLASFRSRNPFKQNLPEPPPETSGTGTDTGTGTDPGLTDIGTSPSPVTPVPSDPSTPTTIPPVDDGEEGSSGNKLISIRIDVKVGRPGNLRILEGVKSLDFLPDPQHPVVQYISGEFNLSRAAFVVSSGIEATDGDGKCAPSPDNCQFLLMTPGEEQTFVYRAEEYRLKLLDIERHVRDADAEDLEEGRSSSDSPRGAVRNSYDVVQGG